MVLKFAFNKNDYTTKIQLFPVLEAESHCDLRKNFRSCAGIFRLAASKLAPFGMYFKNRDTVSIYKSFGCKNKASVFTSKAFVLKNNRRKFYFLSFYFGL